MVLSWFFERLIDKPYGYTIVAVAISFIAIVVIITLILGHFLVYGRIQSWPFRDEAAMEEYIEYLTNAIHLKISWYGQ